MHILVFLPDPEERAALCETLRTWMALSCVSMDIVAVEQAVPPQGPAILFWDLDSAPPPSFPQDGSSALFLCSRDPQRAIDSYSFHPDGFFTRPVAMDKLWNAMLRCARLWFTDLLRLEILSERLKVGIPFQNLMWLEGTRRGCLIHTSHQSIAAREPLYQLEQRLPELIFTRCQRSFVVNLTYVQEISGGSLFLSDGTQLSLGRGNKSSVAEAYRRYRQLRYGS